jgi:hypothetical protein
MSLRPVLFTLLALASGCAPASEWQNRRLTVGPSAGAASCRYYDVVRPCDGRPSTPEPATPLFVIDGRVFDSTTDSLRDISPDQITVMKIVRGPKSRLLFGEAGRDGAVMVWTRDRQRRNGS